MEMTKPIKDTMIVIFLSTRSLWIIIRKFVPYVLLNAIKNTDTASIRNTVMEFKNSADKNSSIMYGAKIMRNIATATPMVRFIVANILCFSIFRDKNGKNTREIKLIN